METLIITVLICGKIVLVAVTAYFFAESRTRRKYIETQVEHLTALKLERDDLLKQLLVKNGAKPIGHQPKERKESEIVTPQVATRSMLEQQTHQVTTHSEGVDYPRVPDSVIEKAKKIVNDRTHS